MMFVYSANIGGYDINYNGRKIFTEQQYPLDKVKSARYYKVMMPFSPEYGDVVVWLDANIAIHCGLKIFVEEYLIGGVDLVLMEHGRNCIYDEAEACIERKKDSPFRIKQQMAYYRDKGYPEQNGMVGTGIMIRRVTAPIKKLMFLWWEEIRKGSHRDQLSFNYVLWKYWHEYKFLGEIKINYIPYSVFGKEFKLHPHKK